MSPFTAYALTHGLLEDLSGDPFPGQLLGWAEGRLSLAAGGTHFGYVHAGPAVLTCPAGSFTLAAGMYFALPDAGSITGGRGIVITRLGYRGFFHLGGPVEAAGRLHYIDGCTDSLLIPPVIKGDACLNLLHLPPGTRQTPHTHPSVRVGLVLRGAGECVTAAGRAPLAPGLAFVIRAGGRHCFETDRDSLLVLAYHPDSDFGPTHQDHPMINRTIVSPK